MGRRTSSPCERGSFRRERSSFLFPSETRKSVMGPFSFSRLQSRYPHCWGFAPKTCFGILTSKRVTPLGSTLIDGERRYTGTEALARYRADSHRDETRLLTRTNSQPSSG